MTLILKDPAALLDYAVDWGADYLTNDTIDTSAWTIDPAEAGGITVSSSETELTVARVTGVGGIAGRVYRLVNHVVFLSGRQDQRSIVVRVEPR